MGIIFKARGSSSFGLFLIRITIGFIFLISGTIKVMDIEGYIEYVKSLDILTENLSFIIGFIIPFAEIIFGALYVIGFLTPLTSLVLSVFAICTLAVSGIIPVYYIPFNVPTYSFNFVILACTITTLFSGAGVISFDVFLDKKKKKVIEPEVKVKANIDVQNVQDAKFESIKDEKEGKKDISIEINTKNESSKTGNKDSDIKKNDPD